MLDKVRLNCCVVKLFFLRGKMRGKIKVGTIKLITIKASAIKMRSVRKGNNCVFTTKGKLKAIAKVIVPCTPLKAKTQLLRQCCCEVFAGTFTKLKCAQIRRKTVITTYSPIANTNNCEK